MRFHLATISTLASLTLALPKQSSDPTSSLHLTPDEHVVDGSKDLPGGTASDGSQLQSKAAYEYTNCYSDRDCGKGAPYCVQIDPKTHLGHCVKKPFSVLC
ncbi:hypothetical protein G6O67_006248 [Ophiocordyceps sinensis]|uniref:Uncharacterized protein n=1 Tax=Ophiocordyceps sinensis TaxID=72228 RepID=A0A8H4LWH6_9HYPO|nr:hypothetical protein G6O67_006248 [Ophiocordyceps sinensis]